MLRSRGKPARHAAIAGDRPPRYGIQRGPFSRRARACPSPCCDRGGNPLGCASGIRGPPRYGIQRGPFSRRARACPSPCNNRGGNPRASQRSRGTGPRATVPLKPTLFTLIPGVEFTEIGTKTSRTGVTIPIVGIFREFGFAAAAEPCHERGISAAAFNFV